MFDSGVDMGGGCGGELCEPKLSLCAGSLPSMASTACVLSISPPPSQRLMPPLSVHYPPPLPLTRAPPLALAAAVVADLPPVLEVGGGAGVHVQSLEPI
jgi:hypothetical protein